MDDGVIIDGQNIDLPLNLRTIADHFSDAGWNTSAYGKWLVGCAFLLLLISLLLLLSFALLLLLLSGTQARSSP